MGTLVRRCAVMLAFWLFAASPTFAVALMNGSQLSMNGLTLTVSNCSLILAGWQQTSCAAGDLALQAATGRHGTTLGYRISGDGTGPNGTDIFDAPAAGWWNSGLYQVSFTLSVATTRPGLMVSAATLSMRGSDTSSGGSNATVSQRFSAAAGGAVLNADLLSKPSVSTILASASAFTINETIAVNSWGWPRDDYCWDPLTLRLGSMKQTFAAASEPSSVLVLMTGVSALSLLLARRRRR